MKRMPSSKRIREALDTMLEVYVCEQDKSGMVTPIPYCFVEDNDRGYLAVFSAFGKNSKEILARLKTMGQGV